MQCKGVLMSRPILLDLYCCAGGAARGYHVAGFEVIGVDIEPQPRYPYRLVQASALNMLDTLIFGGTVQDANISIDSELFFGPKIRLEDIAAIHASPPCQRYSRMSSCRPGLAGDYPDLVGATRERLELTGKPYVIENVPGAPLNNPIMLCGQMFGLDLYRHRNFETNFDVDAPAAEGGLLEFLKKNPDCGWPHVKPGSAAGHWKPGQVISVSGHCSPIAIARAAMDIDWMTRDELSEAIPPAYTEYIGKHLMEAIQLPEAA
jgi:DNA (cytosine-5)-methyltransferase 1